jgi:hypothetical protein
VRRILGFPGWLARLAKEYQLLSGLGVVALLALIAVLASGKSSAHGSHGASGSKSNPTAPAAVNGAETTTTQTSPAAPPGTYLSSLSPIAGDTPQTGDVQIGSRDFPDSVFYEHIYVGSPDEGPCANVDKCRRIEYELGGKYVTFTATFAITAQREQQPEGHWWIELDGKVARQGSFTGREPEELEIPLEGAKTLELRVAAPEMNVGETEFIWGNAELEP